MELRGTQVHFISVIKGGEIIKMHNIARGKSVLKFKNIEQIYDSNDSNSEESLPEHPPKANRTLATCNGGDKSTAEVKRECMEEENELDFGTVTLKQLKQTCKSKKRKAPKFVKLAPMKQEVSDLPCDEDELELKETLVSWKRKVLNKVKSKKTKKSNCDSRFPKIDNLSCISEDTPSCLALVDIDYEIFNPLQIKIEDPAPNSMQPQALSFILNDCHLSSASEMTRTDECCSSDKDLKTNFEDLQRGYPTHRFIENSVQLESIETPNCVLNQISYDLIEHMGNDPNIPESCSFKETTLIDSGVTDQPSVCYGLEFSREDLTDSMTCDESPERVLSECDPVVFQDYVSPLSCFPVIQPSNTSEDLTASETNENVTMMSHPPEKLLSARKIISPTSQERLCKAMNFDDQQDDAEFHSCKETLLFEQNEARSSSFSQGVKRVRIVSSYKRPETMNTVEIRTTGRERMRKRKTSHSRGSVNGTQVSPASQNVCNSVQICSQNAIAFSKRQVHDIERIATKLMTGLQSMKSIVVDVLQHESRTGAKFRYNTDEVKVAVESVTKAEETAQRWLGMMSRDCDRFCKIMKLAEADAPSPEKSERENQSSPDTKTVPKERKIMFADEVGGSLCTVKVFKNLETDYDLAV